MIDNEELEFFEIKPLFDNEAKTPRSDNPFEGFEEISDPISQLIDQIIANTEQDTNESKKLISENEASHCKFIKEITMSGISLFFINSVNFTSNFINAIMMAQSSESNILEASNFIGSIGTAATLSSVATMFSLTSMVANDYGKYLKIETEKLRLLQYQQNRRSASQASDRISHIHNMDELLSQIQDKIDVYDEAAITQLRVTGEGLRSGWLVGAIISIPTALSLAFAVGPFLKGVNVSGSVADLTQAYFQASFIGIPGLILTAGSAQFIVGINKGFVVVLPTIISLAISLSVGYSLKYSAGLGIKGLGYADSIDAWTSCLVYWLILLRKEFIGSKIYTFQFNWRKVREIFRKGSAIAFSMLVELGPIVGMSLMASNYSKLALSAQNVAVQYNNIIYLPIITGNLVATQLVGKYRGAKFYKNTRQMGFHIIAFNVGVSSLITLLLLGLRRNIITIFVQSETPDRDAMITLSEKILVITAVTQAIDCIRIVASGALQGIKDVNYLLLNNIITLNFIALPVSAFLCFVLDWGAEGIAYGHGFGMFISAISLLHRWNKKSMISALEEDLQKEEESKKNDFSLPGSKYLLDVSSEQVDVSDKSSSFWNCWKRAKKNIAETHKPFCVFM